jgi:chromosomal replication initiation ATPase DnaA
MLRASLSSTLRMRQRNAAFAETPEAQRHRLARLAIDVAITNVFGIGAEALWHCKRGVRDIAEARQAAMYLAHVCCRMSLTEVGAMFGRDRTTVSHACLQVEYRRDNPNFDRALDVLSWALPTLVMREANARATVSAEEIEDQQWM